MSALVNIDTVRQLRDELVAFSAPFAGACEHLGRAMRGKYHALLYAMNDGDASGALSIAEQIRESDLVVGIASTFHDLRERATELVSILGPLAKTVVGLTVVVAGAFLLGEATVLALLLMMGGFVMAMSGIPDKMMSKVLGRD